MLRSVLQELSKRLIARLFTGWCVAASVELIFNPAPFTSRDFMGAVIWWRFAVVFVYIVLMLTVLSYKKDTAVIEAWFLFGASFVYLLLLAFRERNAWFAVGLAAVLFFVLWYLMHDDRMALRGVSLSRSGAGWLIAVAGAGFAVFCIAVTVCRYRAYMSSTWDLGVFAQMFHSMKETGLPLTTCERGEQLSHFAVHLSPALYLLLPGYYLFPTPAYLQVMQTLTLVSGVIPLYLLCRRKGLSIKAQCAVCLCYFCFPALIGGQTYDIHENMFLTPFLLWLLYFYEKKQMPLVWLFALLTFSVKEDAPLYVAAVALFMMSDRRDFRRGVPLFMASVVYFIGAVMWLQMFGEGAMTASRFGPYLPPGEEGLLAVLNTVFTNPGYLFSQVFTTDKIAFLLLMLLPLGGIPLLSRRLSSLTLLIPLLVENVMPSWPYQYSIHYQYVFGGIALLFYLTVHNAAMLPARLRRFLLTAACCVALLLSASQVSPYISSVRNSVNNADDNRVIALTLAAIPDEASVVSDGYYLPAVSARAELYDTVSGKKAEYIVLDLRPGREDDATERDDYFKTRSYRYVCVARHEALVAVYHDTRYSDNS